MMSERFMNSVVRVQKEAKQATAVELWKWNTSGKGSRRTFSGVKRSLRTTQFSVIMGLSEMTWNHGSLIALSC